MSEDQRKVYESSPGSAVMFHDAGPIPETSLAFGFRAWILHLMISLIFSLSYQTAIWSG